MDLWHRTEGVDIESRCKLLCFPRGPPEYFPVKFLLGWRCLESLNSSLCQRESLEVASMPLGDVHREVDKVVLCVRVVSAQSLRQIHAGKQLSP